jgi:FkbM family methyltransferase
MLAQASLHIADLLARASLKSALLERLLSRATHNPLICGPLHVGAVAHGYPRVLQNPEIRIAELGFYRFYVNVSEPLGIESYFFGNPCTVWFTDRLIRSGDVCIDAGANAGHYTFALASRVGRSGKVIDIEANPAMASLVERSIGLGQVGGFVFLERRALWSTSGDTMRFLLSTNTANTGTSSLVDHGVYVTPEVAIDVKTVTLDDLAHERQIDHVRLLKLDVERAEYQVLQGAAGLLSGGSIDYLIVEMEPASPSQALLEAHGYQGRFIDGEQRRLIPPDAAPANQVGDFLYVSPAALERIGQDFSAVDGR